MFKQVEKPLTLITRICLRLTAQTEVKAWFFPGAFHVFSDFFMECSEKKGFLTLFRSSAG